MEKNLTILQTKNMSLKNFLYLLYGGKKDANEVYNEYRRTKGLNSVEKDIEEPLYTNCDKFL